ncbi:hypothetical protein D3C81_2043180 [compost metagenome]
MSEQLKAAKAADKILKKYGVLIDPDTLSPEALRRVARLKNLPPNSDLAKPQHLEQGRLR